VTSEVHLEPADDDRERAVGARDGEEQRAVLDVPVVVDPQEHRVPRQCDGEREDGEEEPVLESVGEVGDDVREDECGGPGCDGEELRPDGGVAVAFYYGWGEVAGVSLLGW